MKYLIIFLLTSFVSVAQIHKTDSIGNFYVIDNKLVWQKYYELEDESELDQILKSNEITNNLDILNFETSAISNLVYINGNNLPQYTRKGFKAFVAVDIKYNEYRVTIKDINFPDFKENYYYNGMKQHSRTGYLESYILRQNGSINRSESSTNVLNSFDYVFDSIFN